MSDIYAFIDEYGDTSIHSEKSGVTTFFIITAVLVSVEDLTALRASAEDIRQKNFQTGEMKSSNVGKNDARRKKVLRELNGLNLRSFSLAVDKRELDKSSGLAWKQPFFKYLNRRLYERIYRVFENVSLVADEHGDEAFMKGFNKYIDARIPPNLFDKRTFKFVNSKDETLLQVADFISGSLARCIDPEKKSTESKAFLEMLAERSVGIEIWPPQSTPDPKEFLDNSVEGKQDEIIRRHCVRQVNLFIERQSMNQDNDELLAQSEVLKLLLFHTLYKNDKAFIPTNKILDYLDTQIGIKLSQYELRSKVISKLRDANVIIASGSKGYKIPISKADIFEFVAHANTIILPMLSRLSRAKKELKLASLGELDILINEDFEQLRKLVEVVEKSPLEVLTS